MDAFEKLQELEEASKKVKKLDNELKTILISQFINLSYEIKKVEANYKENNMSNSDTIQVYYPILNVPNGFVKENERFYRLYDPYKTYIQYEYNLLGREKRELVVSEKVKLNQIFIKLKEDSNIIHVYTTLANIEVCINIGGRNYTFYRKANHEQLMREITKDYNNIQKIITFSQ